MITGKTKLFIMFSSAFMLLIWSCATKDNKLLTDNVDDTQTRISQIDTPKHNKIVGAYFAGWYGEMNPKTFPIDKITHIFYAFAYIEDNKITIGRDIDTANFAHFQNLKKNNPKIKVLISIGGWSRSGKFSDMALKKESRTTFINSTIDFVNKYNLDGVDLDWEYPGLPGNNNIHRKEDKQNFTLLLKEFRNAFDKQNNHLLLTIAAAASNNYLKNVEGNKIHPYLDFINIMTYDYIGEWAKNTGHHTNLYESSEKKTMATHNVINNYIDNGFPAGKLVVGIAFYSRGWKNVHNKNNGLYQPAEGTSELNMSFNLLKDSFIDKDGYVSYWDKAANAPYLWNATKRHFITYENKMSTKAKCNYVIDKNLGGVMFWEYHGDYNNELLNEIDNTLEENTKE